MAVGKKDLRKYAIHYLEGMFSLLGDPRALSVRHVSGRSQQNVLYIESAGGLVATVHVFHARNRGTLVFYPVRQSTK